MSILTFGKAFFDTYADFTTLAMKMASLMDGFMV